MTTKFQRGAKKILKYHGVYVEATPELLDKLELLAADIYAHDTEEGWCCACEADQAFIEARIKEAYNRGVQDCINTIKKKQLDDATALLERIEALRGREKDR